MRGPLVFLAGLCVLLGLVPGLLVPTLARLGPGRDRAHRGGPGVYLPGTGGLPTLALAVALALLVGGLWRARATRRAAPSPAWACGQRVVPALAWTSAGFTKPLRLMLEAVLRPRRELTVRVAARRRCRRSSTTPRCRTCSTRVIYEPVTARCAARRRGGPAPAIGQPAHLPRSTCSGCSSLLLALVRVGVLA